MQLAQLKIAAASLSLSLSLALAEFSAEICNESEQVFLFFSFLLPSFFVFLLYLASISVSAVTSKTLKIVANCLIVRDKCLCLTASER